MAIVATLRHSTPGPLLSTDGSPSSPVASGPVVWPSQRPSRPPPRPAFSASGSSDSSVASGPALIRFAAVACLHNFNHVPLPPPLLPPREGRPPFPIAADPHFNLQLGPGPQSLHLLGLTGVRILYRASLDPASTPIRPHHSCPTPLVPAHFLASAPVNRHGFLSTSPRGFHPASTGAGGGLVGRLGRGERGRSRRHSKLGPMRWRRRMPGSIFAD